MDKLELRCLLRTSLLLAAISDDGERREAAASRVWHRIQERCPCIIIIIRRYLSIYACRNLSRRLRFPRPCHASSMHESAKD